MFLPKLDAPLPLPLPPLNEQRRLVTKIEALKTRSQRVKDALSSIPALLDQFRQSVLAAAFRGALTADWREKNPDVEPAEVLLEKIRLERRRKKQIEIDISQLPDLPDSWVWSTLEKCFDLERGRFSIRPRNDPSCYNGSYPFVQIGDLPREGGIIESYSQTLNEKGLSVSKMFPKGSVLIAIVGATIGNTGILDFDSCCPDSLVAIRSEDYELSKYIEYYMRSKKFIIRNVSYASGGQPNINLQTLNPYPFPLPPYDEIIKINKRLDTLYKFVDVVGVQMIQIYKQTNQLDQSILAEAFRGALVPQDPNDEPASVLLERIRAPHDKLQTKTAKKSTPKTSGRSKKSQPQDEKSIQLELGLE